MMWFRRKPAKVETPEQALRRQDSPGYLAYLMETYTWAPAAIAELERWRKEIGDEGDAQLFQKLRMLEAWRDAYLLSRLKDGPARISLPFLGASRTEEGSLMPRHYHRDWMAIEMQGAGGPTS